MRFLKRWNSAAPGNSQRPGCLGVREGLTLIEVMAGLAILGSVLVAVVMARGRYLDQSVAARHKAEAVRVADALLTQWWDDIEQLPRAESGDVDGFRWETQTRQPEALIELEAEVLRLSLFQLEAIGDGSYEPILSVEVVVPAPPESPDTEEGATDEAA